MDDEHDQTNRRRRHGRGSIGLVLLGAAAVAGCGPTPPSAEERPQELQRAQYASLSDCLNDWDQPENCESTPAPVAQTSTTSHSTSSAPVWWGPFYSRSGTVYHYDGRESRLQRQPSHAAEVQSRLLSANQVYSLGGRYGSVAPHASAGLAKASRGGFGSSGRGGSSGGG